MNETLEIVDLENALSDTLKCAGGHNPCSIDATHLIIWCEKPVPVCTAYKHTFDTCPPRFKCGGCKRPVHECWDLVPV